MQNSGASNSTLKKASKTANLAVSDVLKTVMGSLDDSKAEDLVTIDINEKSALADYMVIATGRSNRHVSAIADHLLRELKNIGAGSAKVEGLQSADWVLIDTQQGNVRKAPEEYLTHFKLPAFGTGNEGLLFNLKEDPRQSHDLYAKHPDKVKSMRSLLKRYLGGERCAP